MAKYHEKTYLEKIGSAGWQHAKHKPFSNHDCGLTLASIGTIMALMPSLPSRVLDLGCGSGWTSLFFARHGYNVVGQDISPSMIALAEECKAETPVSGSVDFVVSDYESMNFTEEFDCAVFFDCLHHADDERAAIAAVYKALKPGGILITHEPGEGHAKTEASIEAMERYGVNERDMPPSLIIGHGLELGFSNYRVYPMQHDILAMLYGTAPPRKLWSKRGIRHAIQLVRRLSRPSLSNGGIVVLTK